MINLNKCHFHYFLQNSKIIFFLALKSYNPLLDTDTCLRKKVLYTFNLGIFVLRQVPVPLELHYVYIQVTLHMYMYACMIPQMSYYLLLR